MICVKNIQKKYGDLTVLNGLDLSLNKGEITAIVGPSGAGKSTLLQIMGALEKPDSGEVIIDEVDILKLSSKELSAWVNANLGFVFQFHHLLPEFTALENVLIPVRIGNGDIKQKEVKARELLTTLGLQDRMDHKPNQMSGGEQQRVAVARALINDPQIVFADEPSGNLDSKNADHLHNLFVQLKNELGQTFVIVTHNKELANAADTVVEMADGSICS